MSLFSTLTSRRYLIGGLAASLGLAAAAAPIVASPASSEPLEGTGPSHPQTISPPGTYSSCTAYFGLTKVTDADLISYHVDVIDGAVTPAPVIGTDLVPVLTVKDASNNVIECIPELAWTDQTTWRTIYFTSSDSARMTGLVTYPGTGYYRIPSTFGKTFHTGPTTTFTPTSTSIRFEYDYTGVIVSRTPSSVVPTADGVFSPNPVTEADLSNAIFTTLFDDVETTGSPAQSAYLLSWWNDYVDSIACTDADPMFAPTASTMATLIPGVAFDHCTDFYLGTQMFYQAKIFGKKVTNSLVTVTIADPPLPTTTTTTMPTSTSTSTSTTPAVAIVPRFTG